MPGKSWRPFERAMAWRAYEGNQSSNVEVERLCELFGVSERALKAQAKKFSGSDDPASAYEEELKPFQKTQSTMAYQLMGWVLHGTRKVDNPQYENMKDTLFSGTPGKTDVRRTRKERTDFLDNIYHSKGAPEVSGDTLGNGTLVALPSQEWAEGLREHLPKWGWVRLFYVPCTHMEEEVVCGHPIPIKLHRLVKWLDQVIRWNTDNPDKPNRVIQNRERCLACYEQYTKSRDLVNRVQNLKQRAHNTVVSQAAEKRKEEQEKRQQETNAAAERREQMRGIRALKEEELKAKLKKAEDLMELDPSAAIKLLQKLQEETLI